MVYHGMVHHGLPRGFLGMVIPPGMLVTGWYTMIEYLPWYTMWLFWGVVIPWYTTWYYHTQKTMWYTMVIFYGIPW